MKDAYDHRWTDVPCPTCGADVGDLCTYKRDRHNPHRTHVQRSERSIRKRSREAEAAGTILRLPPPPVTKYDDGRHASRVFAAVVRLAHREPDKAVSFRVLREAYDAALDGTDVNRMRYTAFRDAARTALGPSRFVRGHRVVWEFADVVQHTSTTTDTDDKEVTP